MLQFILIDKSFRGLVSIEEALQRSLNVPFVNLLKEFSVSRFQNICIKSGLQTLDKPADHYGLSLILGGGEITLWDVAGAYASMARTLTTFRTKESKYTADDWHDPTFFKQALSQNNLTFEPYVFHAGSIYQCFEAMSALKRPDEEGMWEEFSSSKKIAWKTGTSFGNKDAWAIGVNKNYTIGIWLGNANGNGRSNIMGVKIAAPVLFDVFNKLKGNEWFDKPYDDLAKMAICKESGYKANTACINNDTIYLQSSTSKMDLCQYHQIIYLDETNTYQVKYDCYPHHKIKQEVQLMIPAYLSEYYRLHHPEYKPVPSMHPKCAHLSDNSASPLDIIYPINNLVIHPLKLKNGKREEIILRATSINPKGKLYWYLNEEFLGSTFQFHSKSKSLEAGSYTLLITDDEGKTAKVNFQIK
jgi:penicillin-binding protein 1C